MRNILRAKVEQHEYVRLKLLATNDRELIEDLLPAAVNQAVAKSKQLHVEAMQSITEGVDLGDMNSLLAQLSGGDPSKPPA